MLVGQCIYYEDRKLTIIRLLKNVNNKDIIEWESHKPNHQHGVCIPSLWTEWKNGLDKTVRRGDKKRIKKIRGRIRVIKRSGGQAGV